MKKIYTVLFFLTLTLAVRAAPPVEAEATVETVYVTDNLRVNLRASEDKTSPVIDVVSSGAAMSVLSNTLTGYRKVKLENGKEGYLLARFTTKTPPSIWHLQQAKKQLEVLQTENSRIQGLLDDVLGNAADPELNQDSVTEKRNNLIREIIELRQLSSNTLEIKQQRNQLQERVVSAERELQQLKRENQALEDSSNQEWFLYGGILAFTGIFLGILIPKLSNQGNSNWDSF